ncbi:hypothetical protein [Manitoba virus]|uniref:Uncharacterized protein n=1 Tax=Manitoba virus TaxID=1272949 RepID=A0A0D3R1E0_9RHAB|nr:hypothetical protein [Manitoba virus]AJR28468.1 hypothetical protein [Manitoba virus]
MFILLSTDLIISCMIKMDFYYINLYLEFSLPKSAYCYAALIHIEKRLQDIISKKYKILSGIISGWAISNLEVVPGNYGLVECQSIIQDAIQIKFDPTSVCNDLVVNKRFELKVLQWVIPIKLLLEVNRSHFPIGSRLTSLWGRRGDSFMIHDEMWDIKTVANRLGFADAI